jgi:hypothetical protein
VRRRAAAALAAGVLLAGCGDDAPTEEASPSTVGSTVASTLPDLGDCEFLAGLIEGGSLGADLAGAGGDIAEIYRRVADEVRSAADAAPEELRAAMDVYAGGIEAAADAAKDVHDAKAQTDPSVLAAMTGPLQTPEFTAAREEITAFTTANCS